MPMANAFTMVTAVLGLALGLGLGLAACGGKSSSPAISNSGGAGEETPAAGPAAGQGFRDGALWSCQIGDYDPQPCKLQRTADGWELRKLMGSQRFIGVLALEEGGDMLFFNGRFFCPWGACDADMELLMSPEGEGYVGQFDRDSIRLRYDEALEAEYGGAGYGGLTGEEQ